MPAKKVPDTARHQLDAELTPLLPASWRIVPYQKNLDALSTVVVMLKLARIEKNPAAPRGGLKTTWTITVVNPAKTDIEKAEDGLDQDVAALCLAIDAIRGVKWTGADKVLFQDAYLAFDISVELLATNTNQKD